MALKVNTNVEAINIHNNLLKTNLKIARSLEKLSSGYRINHARDDAAGYAVANAFRARISSLRVAYQNATESNSMLQVADGVYNKMQDLLIRMKDLATQAAGGQITDTERDHLQVEFERLQAEIDRIAQGTKYNGVNLVYSAAPDTINLTFQIGADAEDYDRLYVALRAVSSDALGVGTTDIAIDNMLSAQAAMSVIDTALTSVNTYTADLGAAQNRLQHAMDNLNVMIENFTASESAIRDVDMAFEITVFTKNQIVQQAGMAMLAQANTAPQQILQLLGG